MKNLENIQRMYEEQNRQFMNQIKVEFENKQKKLKEIAEKEKKKRNSNYEAYINEMNRIEKSMKEKEEQTKKEIALYRQQTENIIRQIKEKSNLMCISSLDLINYIKNNFNNNNFFNSFFYH